MNLTKKKAKELCLIKWDFFRKTGGHTYKDIDEKDLLKIRNLSNTCGYCHKYSDHSPFSRKNRCTKCPLFKLWGMCCHSKSRKDLFSKWANANTIRTRKKYADLMYTDIERS
jgi:hypothetical protein